jgi:hypothetical protein
LNKDELHKDKSRIYHQQIESKRISAAKTESFSFWRQWKDFIFHPKVKAASFPTEQKVSYLQLSEDEARVVSFPNFLIEYELNF